MEVSENVLRLQMLAARFDNCLTQQHELQVDAAIIAHGSRMDLPMIETIQKPVLFVCPENDSQMDAHFRGEVEEVCL